jgi:small subunit ribosomal protein S6
VKHYELLFVLKPTLTEEELKAKFDFISSVLTTNGCEIKSVNNMGVRKLAYEIDKFERGYYFVIYFVADPSSLDEILRHLRLTEEILRFLNIKFETKKEISYWEKISQGSTKEDKKDVEPVKRENPEGE